MRPAGWVFLLLFLGGMVHAQEPTDAVATPCLQPPPPLSWEDYEGPLKKMVGALGQRLERRSAHPPHYKPGTVLCSLEPVDKFRLFVQDSTDPIAFLTAGFNAGLDQSANQDPTFGQGSLGYGKRVGANLAGQTTSRFFGDFAYPILFSEDPRYYRQGHGGAGSRLFHAMGHAVVAHRDNGKHMFNYSEWLGTATGVALNNFYHPGNQRGLAPAARSVTYNVLQDVGFDILREFWPELARKFKLPFRDRNEP